MDPTMQTLGTEQPSGADSSTAQIGTPAVEPTATGAPSEQPASSGDVAAEDRGPIPYDRFQQVVTERNQVRDQLTQYSQVAGFIPLVQQLQAAGYTPEQVTEYLLATRQAPTPQQSQPQQAAPDPQEAFHAALAARGVDPFSLDPSSYALAQMNWENAQQIREFQEFRQTQQVQGIQQQLTSEMQQVTQKYPLFQNQAFQRALFSTWGTMAEAGSNATLEQVAAEMHGAIEARDREQLAHYAAGKAQDAQVPVVAGGSAPPPAPTQNFHQASPEERRKMVEEHMAAITRTA